jgi:hypothetical protein
LFIHWKIYFPPWGWVDISCCLFGRGKYGRGTGKKKICRRKRIKEKGKWKYKSYA